MRPHRRQGGFTLIETLITLVILGIVGLSLLQVLRVSKGSVEDQKAILEAQQNARIALNTISGELRHVSVGKDLTQPSIYYAGLDSLVFVANILDNPGAEVISFYLAPDGDGDTANPNDTILMKTVRDSTGNLLLNSPQSYGMTVHGLQLRYFNGRGVEFARPVLNPELIGEVELAVTGTSPQELRAGGYHDVRLSTRIYPRNLPLSAGRTRPNPPALVSVTSPHCEAITVRWNPPTQNTDGSALAFEEIAHYSIYIGTGPSERSLNARVARHLNEWTVGDLSAGELYYIFVTCTNVTGVESHPATQVEDLLLGYVPEPVGSMYAALAGQTAYLSWSAVGSFVDGTLIVTPITYSVYRGDSPGFPLDETTILGTTSSTTYVDPNVPDCARSFYAVTATSCQAEGDPSAEALVVSPAPLACVADLTADTGSGPGELYAEWTPPNRRIDGTLIAPEDIDHYYVYYDTIPGGYQDSVLVNGDQTVITGLEPCATYHVNVRAFDSCGHAGDRCPANEVPVTLSSPCVPGAPEPPVGLTATSNDDEIHLSWVETPDCDLEGYRVWYGYNAGGPYTGVGAAEGSSPITVSAESITSGGMCNFTLSGLDYCTSFYVVVTAYDRCGLSGESQLSAEAGAGTTCLTCAIEETCSPWVATGNAFENVVFHVHGEGGEEVSQLRPSWAGSEALLGVRVDGTLVWSHDGTAGRDGSIGPVASGDEIRPDPFSIPPGTAGHRGSEIRLAFTGDMRGQDLDIGFVADGGLCSAEGVAKRALLLDDFTDGDITGWEALSGTWNATEGYLEQVDPVPNAYWITNSSLSYSDDFVFEANLNMISGYYGYMQFNQFGDNERYFAMLLAQDRSLELGATLPSYTSFATGSFPFSLGEWNRIRIEKEGTIYRVYGNCELILEASIFPAPPGGRFGFGEVATEMRFDDVRIVER